MTPKALLKLQSAYSHHEMDGSLPTQRQDAQLFQRSAAFAFRSPVPEGKNNGKRQGRKA